MRGAILKWRETSGFDLYPVHLRSFGWTTVQSSFAISVTANCCSNPAFASTSVLLVSWVFRNLGSHCFRVYNVLIFLCLPSHHQAIITLLYWLENICSTRTAMIVATVTVCLSPRKYLDGVIGVLTNEQGNVIALNGVELLDQGVFHYILPG